MKEYAIYTDGKYSGQESFPETPRKGDEVNLDGRIWYMSHARYEAGKDKVSLYFVK